MALRVLQSQHRLAIVKIVPRQKKIETDKIFAQHFYLGVVKLREKRRDRVGRNHRG